MQKTVMCKDVFGNEYETNVDDLEQRIGAYAVIVKNDKILLTKQWEGFSIVGGGVEKGETLEDAFVREVKEETGLNVKPGKIIHAATTFFKRDKDATPRQSFQFYMTHEGPIVGEVVNNALTESEKTYTNDSPEWIDLSGTDEIDLRHSVDLKTIIDAYRRSV